MSSRRRPNSAASLAPSTASRRSKQEPRVLVKSPSGFELAEAAALRAELEAILDLPEVIARSGMVFEKVGNAMIDGQLADPLHKPRPARVWDWRRAPPTPRKA